MLDSPFAAAVGCFKFLLKAIFLMEQLTCMNLMWLHYHKWAQPRERWLIPGNDQLHENRFCCKKDHLFSLKLDRIVIPWTDLDHPSFFRDCGLSSLQRPGNCGLGPAICLNFYSKQTWAKEQASQKSRHLHSNAWHLKLISWQLGTTWRVQSFCPNIIARMTKCCWERNGTALLLCRNGTALLLCWQKRLRDNIPLSHNLLITITAGLPPPSFFYLPYPMTLESQHLSKIWEIYWQIKQDLFNWQLWLQWNFPHATHERIGCRICCASKLKSWWQQSWTDKLNSGLYNMLTPSQEGQNRVEQSRRRARAGEKMESDVFVWHFYLAKKMAVCMWF